MNRKHISLIVAGIIYVVFITPVFMNIGDIPKAFAMLAFSQILWISQIFPMAYTAIIVFLLMSIHFLTFQEVFGYFGSEIVWLMFSTFILAGAFLKSGLAYRISLIMLKWSGGNTKLLLLMSFLVMSVLTIMIPTNLGRAGLVVSILTGVIHYLQKQGTATNIASSMFIGLNYIIVMTGAFVPTGANYSVYAYGIFQSVSDPNTWTYLFWMKMFVLPILIFIVLLWLLLIWIFPLEKFDNQHVLQYIHNELKTLGNLSMKEIKMLMIALVIVILWILEPYHILSIAQVGLLGSILTLFPGTGFWSWEEAKKHMDWDLLLFFASSLALAQMLIHLGALRWMANYAVQQLPILNHYWSLIIILSVVSLILRMIFLNVLAYMTIMIPLAIMIGDQVQGVSPIGLGMIVLLVGAPGFFFITQAPVNILSYQTGFYSEKQLFKIGIFVSIMWLIIVILTFILYWSHVVAL